MHMNEGRLDSVSHTMKSAKYSHLQKIPVSIKKQKGKETIEQMELYKPLGFEPYYYKNPEITILSSSVPKALLTAEVYLSDTKDKLNTPQTFSMYFRAGAPGKDAVVWLQGSATRQHTVNRSDSSRVFFLVPIVIHKHYLPLRNCRYPRVLNNILRSTSKNPANTCAIVTVVRLSSTMECTSR